MMSVYLSSICHCECEGPGFLEDAYNVFVDMPMRDIASWNAMLLGFAQCGYTGMQTSWKDGVG